MAPERSACAVTGGSVVDDLRPASGPGAVGGTLRSATGSGARPDRGRDRIGGEAGSGAQPDQGPTPIGVGGVIGVAADGPGLTSTRSRPRDPAGHGGV